MTIIKMIEIREASKSQAAEIASLIMTAMTDDCCLYFCGEGYGLEDFRKMMTMLVEREDSQYSYRNTLVAMDVDKVVGISVRWLASPSAMMVDVCMNCATPLSRLPRSISAKIILVWMTRRRRANCILTPWPCFPNIVIRALPESCCWRPRNGLIV